MGQQQLLMLVLGFMVVSMSVYTGTRMTEMYYQNSSRDQLMMNMQGLMGLAESYAKKPVSMGGGGGKYTGLKIISGLLNTAVGKITYTVTAKQIVFTGNGVIKGTNGKSNIKVIGTYTKGKLSVSIRN
jgi:putative copper export protein